MCVKDAAVKHRQMQPLQEAGGLPSSEQASGLGPGPSPHEARAVPPCPGLEGVALHTGLGRGRQSWGGTQGRVLSRRGGNRATGQTDGAGGRCKVSEVPSPAQGLPDPEAQPAPAPGPGAERAAPEQTGGNGKRLRADAARKAGQDPCSRQTPKSETRSQSPAAGFISFPRSSLTM